MWILLFVTNSHLYSDSAKWNGDSEFASGCSVDHDLVSPEPECPYLEIS